MDILSNLYLSVVKEAKKDSEKKDLSKNNKDTNTDDSKDIKVEPSDVKDDSSEYGAGIDPKEVKGQDYSVTDEEITDDNKNKPEDETPAGDPTDYGSGDNAGDDVNVEDDPGGGGDIDDISNEPTDYGDDSGMENGTEEDPPGNQDGGEPVDDTKDKNEKIKKLFLYRDFINLQKFIINNISKIENIDRDSFLYKEIDNQVIKNFVTLKNIVTNYILFKYDNSDYNVNLLNYNNFTTMCKINVQMLKKVSNSNSNR